MRTFLSIWMPLLLFTYCTGGSGDERPVSRHRERLEERSSAQGMDTKPPGSALPEKSRLATDLQRVAPLQREKKKQSQQQVSQAQEEKRSRQLESELRRIVGSPVICFDPQSREPSLPHTLHISIEAQVTVNGIITRTDVKCPILSEKERSCIQNRVEKGRFTPPVEDAPRTVTTTIVVQKKNESVN